MTKQVSQSDWPEDGLESVANCPICGEKDRKLLYQNLTDRVFFCAPGRWTMYRCESCESAYIDPRPTIETIGVAYRDYYTHSTAQDFSSLSYVGRLRRWLGNGYRNSRFGTRDYPAFPFGGFVGRFSPSASATMDAEMRHLAKGNSGQRLLDVGCGSGQFLRRASSAGWQSVGIDLDPKAVETACSQGFDARLGDVDILDPLADQFDVITMGHVIEHVHDPIKVMKKCLELLKPGGYLWIDTPNLESEGHTKFGADWLHLDPPRHLVIFTLKSMHSALNVAGFTTVEIQPYRRLFKKSFIPSSAISKGLNPFLHKQADVPLGVLRKAELLASGDPRRREYVTVKARKD